MDQEEQERCASTVNLLVSLAGLALGYQRVPAGVCGWDKGTSRDKEVKREDLWDSCGREPADLGIRVGDWVWGNREGRHLFKAADNVTTF